MLRRLEKQLDYPDKQLQSKCLIVGFYDLTNADKR